MFLSYLAFFILFSAKDENRYKAELRKGRRRLTLELVSGVVGGLLDLVGSRFDVIVHLWNSANHKIQIDSANTAHLFVSVYHITWALDKAMHQN